METTISKVCPECKHKIVVLWEQIHGMRIVYEFNGKSYYNAKCPDCGHEWKIKK